MRARARVGAGGVAAPLGHVLRISPRIKIQRLRLMALG